MGDWGSFAPGRALARLLLVAAGGPGLTAGCDAVPTALGGDVDRPARRPGDVALVGNLLIGFVRLPIALLGAPGEGQGDGDDAGEAKEQLAHLRTDRFLHIATPFSALAWKKVSLA